MDSYGKKRKSNYSGQKSRNRPTHSLEPGLRGFICTCNFREKDCIRESYNLLNEYADRSEDGVKVGPSETSLTITAKADGGPDDENIGDADDDDIQSSLNKEIEQLKAEGNKAPAQRRFQVVDSGAKNCLFIRTTVQNPVELVNSILKDLETSKKQKTRFLLRLLPIEATCKAYIEDIKEKADLLFEKYFTAEGKSFSIVFNCRNNKSVSREKVIYELANLVADKNPGNRVDLKQPELAVLVEIIRNICCIAVLPDYYKFRKYNLLEVCGGIEGGSIQGPPDIGNPDVDSEMNVSQAAEEENVNNIQEEMEPAKKTKDNVEEVIP